jgi:hypothetical protein
MKFYQSADTETLRSVSADVHVLTPKSEDDL